VAGNEARKMAVNVVVTKNFVAMKVPMWLWFLLGVAVKACRDLATLFVLGI
jgi:hypothetical protein